MSDARHIDAYCETCQEARDHTVSEEDPGSCVCTFCGNVQLNYETVDA